jgi:hypothetical protein
MLLGLHNSLKVNIIYKGNIMSLNIIAVWIIIGHASGLPSSFKSLQYANLASCEVVTKAALKRSGFGASLECVKVDIIGK